MDRDRPLFQAVRDYALITAGALLVAVGVYFFKFPNNFAIGGVTGIAMILSKLLGGALSSGTIVLIINLILLIIGYAFLGRSFGNRTLYGSLLFSLALKLLELAVPLDGPITNQPMLELAFAVVLPAVGSALLFNLGGSTGGTDIVAMLLKRYSNVNIGRALLITDFFLTAAGIPVFGITAGLYSLLGLLIKATVIDTVIESLNLHKYFTIICDDPGPICDFITKTLNRDATVYEARGAFTNNPKKIVLSVMNRSQAVQLRLYVKEHEPSAFILISNTSEIIGKGFRGV